MSFKPIPVAAVPVCRSRSRRRVRVTVEGSACLVRVFYSWQGNFPAHCRTSQQAHAYVQEQVVFTAKYKPIFSTHRSHYSPMYILMVVLLLGIAPACSVFYEHSYLHATTPLLFLIGRWFTFWAVGVRLVIAGLRQTIQPRFTAYEIFKVDGEAVFPVVREVGFGNLSIGTLGLATMIWPMWVLAGALVGGLYYGLAGCMHLFGRDRNLNENVAMVSDIAIAVVLLACLVLSLMSSAQG